MLQSYLLLPNPFLDQTDGDAKLSLVLGQKRHLGGSVHRLAQLQLTPDTKTPQLSNRLPSVPDEGRDSFRGHGNLGRQALSDLLFYHVGVFFCMKFRKAVVAKSPKTKRVRVGEKRKVGRRPPRAGYDNYTGVCENAKFFDIVKNLAFTLALILTR